MARINSRQKGAAAERELASFLRDHGWDARRGVQFAGSPDSPDVIGLPGWHIECKRVEKLNMRDAVAQAEGDSGGKPWVVMHRWNHGIWLATVKGTAFLRLVGETTGVKPVELCPEIAHIHRPN